MNIRTDRTKPNDTFDIKIFLNDELSFVLKFFICITKWNIMKMIIARVIRLLKFEIFKEKYKKINDPM